MLDVNLPMICLQVGICFGHTQALTTFVLPDLSTNSLDLFLLYNWTPLTYAALRSFWRIWSVAATHETTISLNTMPLYCAKVRKEFRYPNTKTWLEVWGLSVYPSTSNALFVCTWCELQERLQLDVSYLLYLTPYARETLNKECSLGEDYYHAGKSTPLAVVLHFVVFPQSSAKSYAHSLNVKNILSAQGYYIYC